MPLKSPSFNSAAKSKTARAGADWKNGWLAGGETSSPALIQALDAGSW